MLAIPSSLAPHPSTADRISRSSSQGGDFLPGGTLSGRFVPACYQSRTAPRLPLAEQRVPLTFLPDNRLSGFTRRTRMVRLRRLQSVDGSLRLPLLQNGACAFPSLRSSVS